MAINIQVDTQGGKISGSEAARAAAIKNTREAQRNNIDRRRRRRRMWMMMIRMRNLYRDE